MNNIKTTKLFLALINACMDLLSPVSCPVCKKNLLKFPCPICPACKTALLESKIPPAVTTAYMSKIWSCFFYENIAKNCIHQFKYRQKPNMTAIFQLNIQHLLLTITPLLKNIDIIIPVPLHKTRKHFRGFNQTELIAKILSKNLSIPIKPNILIKTKKTMPQVNLPRQERIINLKNCFCVQNSRIIHGKNILIVDDVTTTGTTLNICAKELITRGAKEIFGFTLAKTR